MVLAGCTLPVLQKSSSTTVIADPIKQFQQQAEDLGNTIELESQMQNLFASQAKSEDVNFTYPIEAYTTARTQKTFGQYIEPDSGDRFSGYHTGDDVEVSDRSVEVPVYVLADAMVIQKQVVSGYGGVVILEFTADAVTYHALYGHLDLASVTAEVGDQLKQGDQLGVLGEDQSTETDGERKHLHFGLYPYTGTELYAGYVQNNADLVHWINPADFLREHQAIAAK